MTSTTAPADSGWIPTTEITETLVTDVQVGMVRAWNDRMASTVEKIVPEGRVWVRITYRSHKRQATPRADGSHYNTVSIRARRDSYLPIVTGARCADCEA